MVEELMRQDFVFVLAPDVIAHRMRPCSKTNPTAGLARIEIVTLEIALALLDLKCSIGASLQNASRCAVNYANHALSFIYNNSAAISAATYEGPG
jgi:hypothetical protein